MEPSVDGYPTYESLMTVLRNVMIKNISDDEDPFLFIAENYILPDYLVNEYEKKKV